MTPPSNASTHLDWQPLRSSAQGLVAQLVEHFSAQVRNHGLRAGARLPSVRALASSAAVSRDTVVQAYDRLAAQGLIQSRRGSGFYVAAQRPLTAAAPTPATAAMPAPQTFDTTYLLRSMFREGGDASTGCLPPSWLDHGLITGAMRALARQGTRAELSLLDYGPSQGFAPLRQHIAAVLQAQEVPAHPRLNLMTVAGVTQGLDLIVRCFLQPGDTVLVEDPAWFLIFGRLQTMGVHVVGVPRLPGGPDVQALQTLAQAHQPKLFILNTAVHNPTGLSLSASVAHEVLRIAERHDFLLVEDDTYADFLGSRPLRLAALDGLQRVLLVGGYAKTLSGGLRVGYIAAQPDYVSRLTDLKLLAGLTTSLPAEHIVHHILADGSYRKHIDRLRDRVDRARQRCLRKLQALDCHAPHEPVAGTFAWVDCGVDTEVLARQAAQNGLLLAPGLLFSPQQTTSRLLRVPVTMADQAAPWKLLEQLLQTLRR